MTERVNSFDTEQVLMSTFMEQKEKVAQKNVKQLEQGKDSNGGNLKPYASAEYADYKHKLNPSAGFGNPDLKLTGNYHKTIEVEQTGNTAYEVLSKESSDKVAFLDKHYGRQQYGMNDDSVNDFIKDDYRNALHQKFSSILKTA